MKCTKCGTENPDGAKFCNECGGKLEIVCPKCGTSNSPGSKFCNECGHNLALAPQAPPQPALKEQSLDDKLAKIEKYLPTGLAEKILAQRGRIEGERRQVTVMFVDLKEFTPLTEKLGPEKTFDLIDQVFELLIHKVHDYEGTVNELRGDGVLALFGAPIALEDAPQRAIRSALSIHREMTRFSDRVRREMDIPPLLVRVGINTGSVVVGTLGNDLRVQFNAVGDVINMAGRMEQMAEPGTTYVTEDTFKLTEGYFRFEALGEKQIKGKKKPLKVYRVIAPSSLRTRFEVSAERGLTPLVARGRELELLLEGFEEVKAGNGRAFSIAAEAGVGKSRLLYEFRKAVGREVVTFLEGKCLSYGRGMAYQPIIDIVKGNFYLQDGDGDSEIRAKVQKGLEALGMDQASTMPFFLELLSVKDSGIDKLPISPEARKERIMETLKTIVLKGAEMRPLILAIEDLHWIDESSEQTLKQILASIPAARVMLIFTYRLEFLPSWGPKSYHMQVNLNRFAHHDSHAMASYVLGTDLFGKDVEDLILEQTEGIPLFIEEFVKALKELMIIEKKDGRYHLAKDAREISVPSTIQEIIMSRVDSLPEGARRVLQSGAVIEREFSYELIRRVTGLLERDLLSHMSVLKDSELIYERGIFPQSSYIFKHALTRDAVYDSILSDRKKRLHEQIAFAIEELYEGNLEQHYGALAEHYADAENHENAAHYYRLAAQKAEKTASMNDAIGYTEKAVACLEKLPLTDETQKRRIDARADLGSYCLQMTQYRSAREAVQPVVDAASAASSERLPQILTIVGTYDYMVDEDVKALERFEYAAGIADDFKDVRSLLLVHYRFGLALCLSCEFERGTYHLEKALEFMVSVRNLWGISRSKTYLGLFDHFLAGRVDSAESVGFDALRYAEESGDMYSQAMAYTCHGASRFGKGLLQEALMYTSKGADLSEKLSYRIFQAVADWILGEVLFEIGQYGTSRDHFAEAVSILEQEKSIPSFLGAMKTGLAMAAVMCGEKDVYLESLYEHIRHNKLKVYQGWNLRYFSELLLNIDNQRLTEAEEWIDKAVEWHETNNMRWWLGRAYIISSKLLKRKGDLPKAREHLTEAIEIFKECGADGWVTKYEEELAKLS